MEEDRVVWPALLAAYIRGYHAENDSIKIFDDFLANQFLSQEERLTIEKFHMTFLQQTVDPVTYASFADQAHALHWWMQTIAPAALTISCARYTEDRLEEDFRQGIEQYVILGAGMDTFPLRRREMLEYLEVFEVDHPTTQAFKRRRFDDLGWKVPQYLHFVPVNFTHHNLDTELQWSWYDSDKLTFFSWLGVTYYLPRETVFATLRSITNIAPRGSKIIFDYLDTDAFVPGKAAARVQGFLSSAQQEGTPLNFGFNPSKLAADLTGVGLRLEEDLSPSDIQIRYFEGRTDSYYACEHAHYACAVVE